MTVRDDRPEPIEGDYNDRYIRQRGECFECGAKRGTYHATGCDWGGIVGHSRTRQAHPAPDWPPAPKLGPPELPRLVIIPGHNHDRAGYPTFPTYRPACPEGCDDVAAIL